MAESDIDGLKTDLHIVERLTQKEEVVYKTLGDAGSVMKLYDTSKEEKFVENAFFKQDENFLDSNQSEGFDFDFSTLFDDADDKTSAVITADPFEKPLSIYKKDEQFYSELFDQLKSSNQVGTNEVSVSNGYLEISNTKDLNQVLFDLPFESKPSIGGLFKLSLDKELVQKSIEDARKKKGEWAEFQVLYELHPVVRYYMTKLEASVHKDSALVAKTKNLPTNSSWFVFYGQVSNNLGQPVIADFLVVGLKWDGSLLRKTFHLSEFIEEFQLKNQLYTEEISVIDLENLQSTLGDAVDWAKEHMVDDQQRLQLSMEKKMSTYQTQLQKWHTEAIQQLEIDFSERSAGNFWSRIKDSKQREIETILSNSSQYYQDLTSLQGEPFLKVLAVFYNK